MTPKISIFVTLGNIGNTPDEWQYAWREAIESYLDFADEVVIVNGEPFNNEDTNDLLYAYRDMLELEEGKKSFKIIDLPWEYDFSWETIAQHFNAGLEACTGDWIMKMDIDYVIHERDMAELKARLEAYYKEKWWVCSFMKYTVLNQHKAYQKVHLPFIIRGDKKELIKFGIPEDDKTSAWGYPIMVNGFDEKRGLPTGTTIPESMVRSTGIDIFNYDNTFRDKETTGKHFLRFSNAREKAGFPREWGSTEEEALQKFIDMMWSRIKKTSGSYKPLLLESHPKYVRDRIKSLTPDLYGYNSWKTNEKS